MFGVCEVLVSRLWQRSVRPLQTRVVLERTAGTDAGSASASDTDADSEEADEEGKEEEAFDEDLLLASTLFYGVRGASCC